MVLDEGSENDRNSIKLATKSGEWIRNVRKLERVPESLREAEIYCRRNCPGIITRSLSATYNCVGLVFALRRVVIETSEIPKILKGDGYYKVNIRAEISPGDIIIYKKGPNLEITHIGVITNLIPDIMVGDVKIMVLSQWGFDGEYIHPEDIVPVYYGTHKEYFSERKFL